MIVPTLLLLVSFSGLLATALVPAWSDLILIAAPATLASLYLLLRALQTGRKPDKTQIILDGSNVMYWRDETPDINTIREVLAHVKSLGLTPGVVFDANAGYLLFNKYQHDKAFGRHLGLPEDRVMVVPKGTPADPMILTAARDLGARVITNDRYRDWIDDFPELHISGHLIQGGYANGKPWLEIDPQPK